MDTVTKNYIDSLDIRNVPWCRMFTAYGTAEHYAELFSELEQTNVDDQWKKTFLRLSDFEHQRTMFPPAPFALVFLVRILQKRLEDGIADDIVEKMVHQFTYYTDICVDAERMKHAQQLEHFSDLLDDKNLLPEECTEEELLNVFENPEAVSDEFFYSLYHYSLIVLSQVPDILDQYRVFPKKSKKLRDMIRSVTGLPEKE